MSGDLRASLTLTADASGYTAVLRGAATELTRLRDAAQGAGRATGEAGTGATALGAGAAAATAPLTALTTSAVTTAAATTAAGAAASSAAVAVTALETSVRRVEPQLALTSRQLGGTAGALRQVEAASAGARRGFQLVDPGLVDIDRGGRRASRSILALAGAFRTLVPLLAAAALARAARSAIQTESAYEQLEIRLRFLTGSQAAANEAMAFASVNATRMGVGVRDLTDAMARLIPIEQAGMLTREQSRSITLGLIDASKALGASSAQLGQVYFGLSQALASPIVRAEELNQVIDPLPGLLQAMDRAITETSNGANTNFRAMVNNGEVTAEMFAATLVRALREFAGASEAATDTIASDWQRLINEWERFERRIVDSVLVRNGIRITTSVVGFLAGPENTLERQIELAEAAYQRQLTLYRQFREGTAGRGMEAPPEMEEAFARPAEEAARHLAALRAQQANIGGASAAAIAQREARELAARREALRGIAADADPTGVKVAGLREQIAILEAAQRDGIDAGVDYADSIARIRAEIDKLEAAPKRASARVRDVAGDLARDLELATMGARQRAVAGAVDRLQPGASAGQVAEVERLAGALYDQAQAARDAAETERDLAAASEARSRAGVSAAQDVRKAMAELAPSYAADAEALARWRDETKATLQDAGGALASHAGDVERVYRSRLKAAYDADLRRRTDWQAGAERGFRAVAEGADDMATAVERGITRGFGAAEDAIVQFAMTGKFAVGDFADSVIADILRMQVQTQISKPLASALGGIDFGGIVGSIFGSVFGGGTTGPTTTAPAMGGGSGTTMGEIFHGGGVIGATSAPRRPLPAALWAGAARYHGGGKILGPGEVPIIAERGERMLTEAGSAQIGALIDALMGAVRGLATGAAGPAGGPGGAIEVHLHGDRARQTRSSTSQTAGGGLRLDLMLDAVEDGLSARVEAGGSRLGRSFERRFGANPVHGLTGG